MARQSSKRSDGVMRLLLVLASLAGLSACATPAEAAAYKICSNGQQVRRNVACPTSPPTFAGQDVTVNETAGTVNVTVTKSGSTTKSSTINYATSGGTAVAGVNYQSISGSLTFSSSQTSKTIPITVLDDRKIAGTLTFGVKLTASSNATIARNAVVSITDNGPVILTQTCPDGSIIPATSTCPNASSPLNGEATIADNFNSAAGIEPTTYPSGIGGGTPGQSIDSVGASRIFCTASHLLRDDPLVYPGQPGVSHLHDFVGNRGTNANSTYSSLRTTGGTTCGGTDAAPVNRSAYWAPAMLDGVGNVVRPDYWLIYYKRLPASNPDCQPGTPYSRGICANLPNGIRYVVGYSMTAMTGGPTDISSEDHSFMYYECYGSVDGTVGPGTATSRYYTIAAVAAAGCPVGAQLVAFIVAPDCWDGHNVDSANHRSHVANGKGVDYGSGRVCDTAHPYVIPQLQVQLHFTTDANFVAGRWHLSSDDMVPGAIAGTTLHMDYWEAWSPTIKGTWTKFCIDGHLSCSSGDLGNGTEIIGVGERDWVKSQKVPVP